MSLQKLLINYQKFLEGSRGTFFQKRWELRNFILVEKNVYPAYLPSYYEDWKKEIEDHLHIPDLSSLNKQRVRELIGEIAHEIVKTKKHILEDYLG